MEAIYGFEKHIVEETLAPKICTARTILDAMTQDNKDNGNGFD